MSLFDLLRGKSPEKRYSLPQYLQDLANGGGYAVMSGTNSYTETESVPNSFTGYAGMFKRNSVVFSAMQKRMTLFSEARFALQDMKDSRPGDLSSGDGLLRLLESPWPNGTTGELLARMIQDADLAGNSYIVRESSTRLRRLRPDWVRIILTAAPAVAVQSDVLGYAYYPGGEGSGVDAELFTVDEVAHWCPIPDPEAQYRGMSWLSPVVREVMADNAATEHKLKFFDNGASLSTVLTLPDTLTTEQHKAWIRKFRDAHQGTRNAYEPLFLGGGADVKVVGADLRQLDFKVTQGGGETRIASASGLSPVILSLSEGLQGSSLNAGNFTASRRLAADGTLRPLWRSASAALSSIVKVPGGSRLWYDDRDIPFLREDVKDLAEIQSVEGQTIRTLIDGGFKPDSIVAAVTAQDWTLLEHTGTFSVQLQPPGAVGADGKPVPAESDGEEAVPTDDAKRDDPQAVLTQANAVGVLVRSGFDGAGALKVAGLPPIEYLPVRPVTVQPIAVAEGTDLPPDGSEGQVAPEDVPTEDAPAPADDDEEQDV